MGLLEKLFPPMSRDKFAARMMRELKRQEGDQRIVYKPKDFSLEFPEKPGNRMFLFNAYTDYAAAPFSRRSDVIRRYASAGLSMREQSGKEVPYAEAKEQLLPRVRERLYHESVRLLTLRDKGPAKDSFVIRPLADDLTLELVRDLPDSIVSVSRKTLEEWKVSFEEALAVAKDNLWKRSNRDFLQHPDGLYISAWQDTHDASRLYLHDLVWQLPVKGAHVAMIPNRNYLLVAGSEDPAALLAMIVFAEAALKESRPMTGVAYRLDGSTWVPFLPPASSPAYERMLMAALRTKLDAHQDTKRQLGMLFEETGRDVFVAGLTGMRRADGSIWTWTSWVDGVTDALMPQADYVTFGRVLDSGKTEALGWGKWEDVMRVASDLLEATEHYPVRFCVKQFPTAEQLSQMNLQPEAT